LVGKTPRVLKDERDRLQTIKIFCGCLPCLLRGHLDRWTTIEHVTERGRRVGIKSDEHANTIGLCLWHHFGACDSGQQRANMTKEMGPALANGRYPFELAFGDEVRILIPVQNFLVAQFDLRPWPEHNVNHRAARRTRNLWIELNRAENSSFIVQSLSS
jgi:hypothetical protein